MHSGDPDTTPFFDTRLVSVSPNDLNNDDERNPHLHRPTRTSKEGALACATVLSPKVT
jgi:hypothetical protein